MLFQPEGAAVFYMWNGNHPILVHCEEEGHWVWGDAISEPVQLTDKEFKVFNEMAAAKRKQVFELNKRRYIVKSRGVFQKEET